MSASTSANEYICNMPHPAVPMVDVATGAITTQWWLWALNIWKRGGSATGIASGDVMNQADTAQTTANAAQASANSAQASANAAQTSANTAQTTANTALAATTAETAARIAADALLLPLTGGTLTGALTAPEYRTTVYTVATLPAGVVSARAYVSNALAPAFGAAVVGGGAVGVPVYYDGISWKVG
jgi:hypothetical protein